MGVYTRNNIITNGLVLCLDAANKMSYAGSGTSWNDLSGNNNTGTLTNGPTFSSNDGGSIVFDGTNDYIECGSNSSIVNVSNNNEFTVEAFVKWNTVPTAGYGQYIMANVNPTNGPPNLTGGFQLGYTPGGYGFTFATYGNNSAINGSGSFEGVSSNSFVPVANNWYHMTGLKLNTGYFGYVNGILVASYLTTSKGGSAPTSLKLGLRERDLNGNQGQFYFNGNISSAKIYNRGLTSSEIIQNYNATKTRFGMN